MRQMDRTLQYFFVHKFTFCQGGKRNNVVGGGGGGYFVSESI